MLADVVAGADSSCFLLRAGWPALARLERGGCRRAVRPLIRSRRAIRRPSSGGGNVVSERDEPPPRAARRRLLIDLTPIRRSRDFRRLILGELVSVFGTQLTTVAVPYQVYQLTRSSLDVGLVSLAQLFPLIAGHRVGGLGRPGVHRRGAAAGPSAARLPPSADAGA